MTSISVSTGQVSMAAGQVQALRRGVQQRARSVDAVLHGLDLQISARGHYDVRLRALITRLDAQDMALSDHSRFLGVAVARYETTETALCAAGNGVGRPGAGEVRVGVPGSRGAPPPHHHGGLFGSFMDFDHVVTFVENETHIPVGAGIALGVEFVTQVLSKAPGLNYVGKALTLASVLNEIEEGDAGGILWDAVGFIPHAAAFQFGYGIGEFTLRHTSVDEWAIGMVQGANGWAPNYDTLGARDALQTVVDGLPAGVTRAWNWMESRLQ